MWQIRWKTSDMPEAHVLPRYFETFDDAWEIARKLIDTYVATNSPPIMLQFEKAGS